MSEALNPSTSSTENSLASEAFMADARVQKARAELLSVLREHKTRLTKVRPPDSSRQMGYAQMLERFQQVRGGALYFPYISSGFGNGALIELLDGSVKYDFISGIGVHFFGHQSELMFHAGIDSALEDTLMQGNLQQNADTEAVLQLFLSLANRTGAKLAHGFITSSGAMANENALKMVFQKKFPARRVLAFEHNFAGRTLVLSQITDKPAYRVGLPPTVSVDYLPYFDAKDPQGSTQKALTVLDDHLSRHPGDHAAFIMELIQGEGGGYREGHASFFKALAEKARAAKVGIVFDEIQTFGRTDHPFAFQHFGLEEFAEVVTVGKLTQACATLIHADYKPGPGLVSQTFTASSAAMKAARYVLTTLQEGDWFGATGKIMALSDFFRNGLRNLAAKYPDKLSGPFGYGAMVAFTPFGGDSKRANAFLQELFQAGVIGFVAGANPTRIRFLLPLGVVTTEDIQAACDIMDKTLSEFGG